MYPARLGRASARQGLLEPGGNSLLSGLRSRFRRSFSRAGRPGMNSELRIGLALPLGGSDQQLTRKQAWNAADGS